MENFREKRLERQLKSQQNISIVMAVVLLLAILGIVYLLVRNSRLNNDKEELQREISMLATEVNFLEESNSELQAEILKLNEENDMLRGSAANLELEIQSREAQIARLNRELLKLEDIRAEVAEYESLEDEYEKLQEEKLELTGELDAVKKHLSELKEIEEQHEALVRRVEEATYLRAYNICVHHFRDRWICRPVVMDVARRVDRTTLSFEINENLLVEPGEKNVHLVITGPDGNVISPSAETFTIEETGETSDFTEHTVIQYDNQPVALDFSIEHDTNLESGTYQVQIFLDGAESGTEEFVLE